MSLKISRLRHLITIILLTFARKIEANSACKNKIQQMMKDHCMSTYKRSVSYADQVPSTRLNLPENGSVSSETNQSEMTTDDILESANNRHSHNKQQISSSYENYPNYRLHRRPRATPLGLFNLQNKKSGFQSQGDGVELGFDLDDPHDEDGEMEILFEELYLRRSARSSQNKSLDKRDFLVYAAQCCEDKELCDSLKNNLPHYCQ